MDKKILILGCILSLFLFVGCSNDKRYDFCKSEGYDNWLFLSGERTCGEIAPCGSFICVKAECNNTATVSKIHHTDSYKFECNNCNNCKY